MQPFDDDVVAAITSYMNENQADGNLSIVHVHAGVADATAARLIDVGGEVARFEVETPTGVSTVDVRWERHRSITTRDQIRDQLVELYMSAG